MSKYVVTCTWDEVPHLSEEDKEDLLASYPPYQRDARSKGIPQLGSGAIYPIPEEDVITAPFEIPAHYLRLYALDVGWNKTAAIWGAKDPETSIIYLYSEYYRGQAEPSVHAEGIRSRGAWIRGVIDPASRARAQKDGIALMDQYRQLGLMISAADHAVEAGIHKAWQMLSEGRMKAFSNLNNWRDEFRLYRRDENGKIVKERDHLMDAMRYLVMEEDKFHKKQPERKPQPQVVESGSQGFGWMR